MVFSKKMKKVDGEELDDHKVNPATKIKVVRSSYSTYEAAHIKNTTGTPKSALPFVSIELGLGVEV